MLRSSGTHTWHAGCILKRANTTPHSFTHFTHSGVSQMFNVNDHTLATEIKHTTNSLPRRNTMTRPTTTLRTICTMTLIVGLALFIGCGTNLSPLGPEQPDTVSNEVIVRTTKPTKGGTTTEKGGKGGKTTKKGGPAEYSWDE